MNRFAKLAAFATLTVLSFVVLGNAMRSPDNQRLTLENDAEQRIFAKVGIPDEYRDAFSTTVEERAKSVEVCFELRSTRQYTVEARYRVLVSQTCEFAPSADAAADRIGTALKGAF